MCRKLLVIPRKITWIQYNATQTRRTCSRANRPYSDLTINPPDAVRTAFEYKKPAWPTCRLETRVAASLHFLFRRDLFQWPKQYKNYRPLAAGGEGHATTSPENSAPASAFVLGLRAFLRRPRLAYRYDSLRNVAVLAGHGYAYARERSVTLTFFNPLHWERYQSVSRLQWAFALHLLNSLYRISGWEDVELTISPWLSMMILNSDAITLKTYSAMLTDTQCLSRRVHGLGLEAQVFRIGVDLGDQCYECSRRVDCWHLTARHPSTAGSNRPRWLYYRTRYTRWTLCAKWRCAQCGWNANVSVQDVWSVRDKNVVVTVLELWSGILRCVTGLAKCSIA